MAKEEELEGTSKKHSTTSGDPGAGRDPNAVPGTDCPFTIQIIHPNGQEFYELTSERLPAPRPVLDQSMLDLVNKEVNMAHQATRGFPQALCGTFFVNLHIFKK